MATNEELRDEERRVRHVRMIVDLTCSVIMQGRIARAEAQALVTAARQRILELFPGRDETYELLYARRFQRLVEECTEPETRRRAVIVRFPSAARK